jgi:hypothetical protein
MKAISELLSLSGVSDSDQAALRDSVPSLAADCAETPVAVAKWKRYLTSGGKQFASAFRDILVDVASETAKRSLFGG